MAELAARNARRHASGNPATIAPIVTVASAPAARPRTTSPRTYTATFDASAPATAPATSIAVRTAMRRSARHRASIVPPSGIVRKVGIVAAAVTRP